MNKLLEAFISSLLICLICVCISILLGGCGMVDFRDKAIATETKVIGLDATVPSLSTGNSLASVRLGYISNKYISAPNQSSASIDDKYTDCSLLSVSGTVDSNLTVTNNNSDTIKKGDK